MKKPLNTLKKKAKKVFNEYIRKRDCPGGWGICVTCGKRMAYGKEVHAGHYKHNLDFIEDNQHAQCSACNTYRDGMLDVYTLYMIDRYGRERVDELHCLRKQVHRYSRQELEDIIERHQSKIKTIHE